MSGRNADSLKSSPVTVSQVFGEIAWLISQSPARRNVLVEDLNWLVMPPVQLRQFHFFRDGERPLGVALWARVNAEGDRKLTDGIFLPGNHLQAQEWAAGDLTWLVDLIAPFSTPKNRQIEIMFGDFVSGRMNGSPFKTRFVDPATEETEVVQIASNCGEQLISQVKKAMGNGA